MKKVIHDCDNTMGVPQKDVDDGLALLYLLGREDIDILGVTTTFGNSTIDIVHSNTESMFSELKLNDIPLVRGAGVNEDRRSDAAKFLLETVKKSPKEVSILATGSLTNLYGAYLLDDKFFTYVKEIVIMGGIQKPLVINNKIMNELNFASDASAAYHVLKYGENATVVTGHLCLQALFGKETYDELMENPSNEVFKYIREKTLPWFNFIGPKYDVEGFYNWDVVAAVYLTNPEIFQDDVEIISSEEEDYKTGLLKTSSDKEGYKVNIPKSIVDMKKFNSLVFEAWEQAF
ncbi:inosine-uridine nucleoside N-ribohydrolase [Acetoanaerobium pronyense]|uniref:Inosine-uridine nucleoside N-ribohydrolase n=1 Tax=Acetoanaerobium pronyense TaxID=1482736 RepID=A0ABS4KL86_9FIRM|nr:nucleoside hydrolase [Acetoanaerobium pronyense]MBP2028524.1 inosine-uridine nucleoside N-ribohydrolase [Acetoanaerobium pronyense]